MRLSTPLLALALAMPLPVLAQDAAPSGPAAVETLPLHGEVRAASATALQNTLYDLIALRHAAHQAHWNVVGSDFYQLHDFFGHLYTDLSPFIDQVAERQRAIGEPSDGRPSAVGAEAGLTEPEPVEMDGPTALAVLLENWNSESSRLYQRIDAVEDDLVTQDLLIAVTALIDKQAWQIRAHLK